MNFVYDVSVKVLIELTLRDSMYVMQLFWRNWRHLAGDRDKQDLLYVIELRNQ